MIFKGDRSREAREEALGAGGGLFEKNLRVDPGRSAVDGNEPVAAHLFVGQLRQVLQVHRDASGYVVLEGLDLGLGVTGPPGPTPRGGAGSSRGRSGRRLRR